MRDFQAAKIRLFYTDPEGDRLKSRTFNHVNQNPTAESIQTFRQAMQALSQEEIVQSSVIEEYLYL